MRAFAQRFFPNASTDVIGIRILGQLTCPGESIDFWIDDLYPIE